MKKTFTIYTHAHMHTLLKRNQFYQSEFLFCSYFFFVVKNNEMITFVNLQHINPPFLIGGVREVAGENMKKSPSGWQTMGGKGSLD